MSSFSLSGSQMFRKSEVQEAAKYLGAAIESACRDGREKSLALTKLEECLMWALTSIHRETE